MAESIETVIIGAGQAGLSTGYTLKQHGLEYIILDKASQPGSAWRTQRWDSFTFVSPNWTFQLPGGEYDGSDPDGYMTRGDLVSCFDRYAEKHQLPIAYNTCVTAVRMADGGGFRIQTQDREYHARNVVAANGWFGAGKTPPFAKKIPPSILQLHSGGYRNPQSLPPGAVLVAGSGQSGSQIAEELLHSGRKVFLATGTAPHSPRRYRGKDVFSWMIGSGFTNQTFEQMSFMGRSFVAPILSGKDGGHTLNLHQFCQDGIILLGHARDYIDGKLVIAPDLKENLGKADAAQKLMLKNYDEYILRAQIDAPPEDVPPRMDGYQVHEVDSLDLQAEGIRTIIWATGYTYDSSMFEFPVLNPFAIPDAPGGVSSTYPGLYFVGFPFLPTLQSGFVIGVRKCAAFVTDKIEESRQRSQRAPL